MKTLELQCPKCEEVLELDAGFAGGVCRCSSCGTLMTVPGQSAHQAALHPGTAVRPEAPSGPRGPANRPASGAAVAGPSEKPVRVTPASAAALQASAGGAAIPVARPKHPPRRWVKVLVTALIALMLAGIAAVVIFAVTTVLRKQNAPVRPVAPPPPLAAMPPTGVDPGNNLFRADQPGFLGFALGQRAVLLIDGSSTSARWFPAIREAVNAAVARAPADTALQVIVWTDVGAQEFPDEPRPLTAEDRDELGRMLLSVVPAHPADAFEAIGKAMAGQPQRIILVCGDVLTDAGMTKLAERTGPVDVLMIGVHSVALQKLAETRHGRYISVSEDLFETWRDEAAKSGQP